ncbi:tetratricopeptide repeat protein [Shewanella ulleungensis]|nr:hypothetical protein [Shewanella ulleungensis]MCL1149842.1 hypothetical protein [Shewanella ulleungensis]
MNEIEHAKYLLAERNFSDFDKLLDRYLAIKPNNYQLLLLKASSFKLRGDTQSAIDTYEEIHQQFSDKIWAAVSLNDLYCEFNNVDFAEKYLAFILASNCDELIKLRSKFRFYSLTKQFDQLVIILTSLIKFDPDNVRWPLTLANLYLSNNAPLNAQEVLSDANKNKLTEKLSLAARLNYAQVQYDVYVQLTKYSEALSLCEGILAIQLSDVAKIHWQLNKLNLLIDGVGLPQAAKYIESIYEGDLNDKVTPSVLNKALLLPISDCFKSRLYHWAVNFIEHPKFRKLATKCFIRFYSQFPIDDSVNKLIIKFNLRDTSLQRDIINDDDSDVIISPVVSDTVIFVFTGLAQATAIPITLLDVAFAKLNLTTVYLRDVNRLFFNQGIQSVATDFDETVIYLKKMYNKLNGKKLIVIGTSAGGYAAVRYGYALGADKICTFGAPFNITAEFMKHDLRAKIAIKRQQIYHESILDLANVIKKGHYAIPIEAYYGEEHPLDKRSAEHVIGFPCVIDKKLPGVSEHDIFQVFHNNGQLDTLIQECLN